MQVSHIRAFFVLLARQGQQTQENLPAYSNLATSPEDPTDTSMADEDTGDDPTFDHYQTTRRRRVALRRLSQFLSHFTLGFADGLTVPFALAAGLSSLGQTETVIYAGMAEVCAGCISMGISGYLAAQGETATKTGTHGHDEKSNEVDQDSIQRYLSVLDLPPDLLQSVKVHIDYHPSISRQLLNNRKSTIDNLTENAEKFVPAAIGVSIAFGYVVGGLLPLFPYFFVSDVNGSLRWSFVTCILALFVFGFAKDYLLRTDSPEDGWQHGGDMARGSTRRGRIKRGLWEGLRMVIMGGLAAVAAVLCVRLFEGVMS